MSDQPPLPPPFSTSGAPPPPPPLPQQQPYPAQPYPAQRDQAPYQPSSTAGLRKAAIVLFWCTAGAAALVAFAALNRRSVWDGYQNGDKTIVDVDDADNVIAGASFVQFLVGVAALIVLSIWSLRTARNAKASGAIGVSPGLACGGWYIPFANLVVPFVQLRRVASHRRQPTSGVSRWQGFLIATFVASLILRSMSNFEVARDADDLTDRLTNQTIMAFVLVVLLAVTAWMATRAMRDVDAEAVPTT